MLRRKSRSNNNDPQHEAYQVAVRQLARREYSRAELRSILIRKSVPVPIVDAVLQRLVDDDHLSDYRFAESVFRHRINSGWGPIRVEQELKQKRVENAIIRAIFAEMLVDWTELARRVREKRFGREIPNDLHDRAKQIRFLQYRGFTTEQVHSACDSEEVAFEL